MSRSSKRWTAAVLAALVLSSLGRVASAVTAESVVQQYADLALAKYEDSLATARTLQGAIEALRENPSPDAMRAARAAWLAARVPYQ